MEFKANDYKPNEIIMFIRENTNMSRKHLAKKVDKSETWVQCNELGINTYYFEDLLKVANACNIDIIFKSRKK
jgi:ribosome-binding protein aMBF1 (putative translation factor)